jgi:hypothetical protein
MDEIIGVWSPGCAEITDDNGRGKMSLVEWQ